MIIGKKDFAIGRRTYLIGIVNVTPDSFFDGGQFNCTEAAVSHAMKLINDGADIIEIGGESTRPGHEKIDEKTEMERVLPVIESLIDKTDTPIAVDTSKSNVADAALSIGAAMINDISCFTFDEELASVCAKHDAACCVMHNRTNTEYRNLLMDVMMDLQRGIYNVEKAGVLANKIIIDPGIGFAKAVYDNLVILRNLSYFAAYEYPLMIGTSRKSFMGKILGLEVNDRLETTLATTALAINSQVDFIRVHDVLENKRVAMMADELVRGRHK